MATSILISPAAHRAGKALAKHDRRTFSGTVEVLILAEARRRKMAAETIPLITHYPEPPTANGEEGES